ncbi:hypothetical protein [Gemmatimonas groenlandica]|uniref:Lipocalin-like domain-containing protein n=1 Tax=Gemmatimonas groenlandica TaxID=2732249 RepID=A0A6M4IXK7_9BACT|nr:hypothetical protein [Gemmatimonas groenlandica]QJR37642.1 hypothetical protein HKW67_20015 [Gemmatimonas groenlandica]
MTGSFIACGNDSPTESDGLSGTYIATTLRITPTGQASIDALAQGGSMTVVINDNRSTGGSLTLPAVVTGGAALTASLAGTAVQTGGTIRFQHSADTFVRDLTFTVGAGVLTVTDQAAGSARFTIRLSRQ